MKTETLTALRCHIEALGHAARHNADLLGRNVIFIIGHLETMPRSSAGRGAASTLQSQLAYISRVEFCDTCLNVLDNDGDIERVLYEAASGSADASGVDGFAKVHSIVHAETVRGLAKGLISMIEDHEGAARTGRP